MSDEFWDGILDLFIVNHDAAKEIGDCIYENINARRSSIEYLRDFNPERKDPNRKTFLEIWEKARIDRKGRLEQITEELETYRRMVADAMTQDSIQKLVDCLHEFDTDWMCELDRQRVTTCYEIADQIEQYFRSDYDGKLNVYYATGLTIVNLKTEIEKHPTRFSIASLHGLLDTLESALESRSKMSTSSRSRNSK